MLYTEQVVVSENDIDENLHVNNLVYLRWAQGISGRHWRALAAPEAIQNFLWVVAHQEISYIKEAFVGDTLTITTWIHATEKAKSYRHIEIKNSNNQLVAKVIITWYLLDRATKKPQRIPTEIIELFTN